MQIELTIRHYGRCTDVVVRTARPVTLGALMPTLATVLGAADGDLDLWHGTQRLSAATALGDTGLRTGVVLDVGSPAGARAAPGVLALHRVGGPGAGGTTSVARGRLSIGRDPACDIVVADADASRRHAVLAVGATSIEVHDCGSMNGTWVDGVRVCANGVALAPGQLIRLGDSTLTVRGPSDVPAVVAATNDGRQRLLRPPRDVPTVSRREILVPQRACSNRPRGVQWVAALLPALAGGGVAWFTHSPQFLLFALLSPVMLLSTSVGDRLHWRKSRRRDAATYSRRRIAADREIADALARERRMRLNAAPDASAIASMAALPGSRLWERRRTDADLLDLRLGLAVLPSMLCVRDGPSVTAAGLLADVPYCVGLRDGPLGVCGPPDVVDGVVRFLVGQLAALHSPADVALSLLLGPGAQARWRWARWLPHLGGRVATCPDEWSAHLAVLTESAERQAGARRGEHSFVDGAWHVVIVDRAADVAEAAGLRALLTIGTSGGISAICVAEDEAELPTSCSTVIRVGGATGTRASARRAGAVVDDARTAAHDGTRQAGGVAHDVASTCPGDHSPDIVLDTVDEGWAEHLARDLAPIADAGLDGSAALPDSCTLLDAIDLPDCAPREIARNWATCDGGARTVIGVGPDGPLTFDLVRDGPHALIAGTTGAGKSELLQTLVAGLAAQHPPEALSLLLIDYKGGAAFGECARLPHTAGLVTDLDGYLTARALRSLNSELRRRERLFAEHGAADLIGYRTATAGPALARLVIVVDEFAALAEELPDFVHGLVGVAQRGRSLGVHLVLATQRPRSAISAEIRANTALRIALRVTDAAESSDVIDVNDAATIGRHTPGRAYLRTGESIVSFQTAHSGAPVRTHDDVSVQVLDAWRGPRADAPADDAPTELQTLVDAIRGAARHTRRESARSPWLPPLPDAVATADLGPSTHPAAVRVALVDLPDEQRRDTLELDLRLGRSLLIAGAPRSGRSTALAALALDAAASHALEDLHLYVVDPTGGLSTALGELPHVATLIGRHDAAPVLTLLRRLTDRCADTGAGGDPTVGGLLLIDSWEALTTSMGDADAAVCADLLIGLLRAGPAAALSIVVAGGRTCLMPRFAGNFGSRLLLALPDRNDYGLAGINPRDVPVVMPPGRGLRADDVTVLQMAHAGRQPGLAAAQEAAAEIAAAHRPTGRLPRRRDGAGAIRIRPLPQQIDLAQVAEVSSPSPGSDGRLLLGVGGDDAQPLCIDLFAGGQQMIVAGPARSGRSTTLISLLMQADHASTRVLVAGGTRSPLARAATAAGVTVIGPHDEVPAGTADPAPAQRTLLLVDDCEQLDDTAAGTALLAWVRAAPDALAVVVAGRSDDLVTAYRGLGAHVRRSSCGLLLRPGPVDGEILGARLPRRPRSGPPGRGVLVGDPAWGGPFTLGEPVPIQIAMPAAQPQLTHTGAPRW